MKPKQLLGTACFLAALLTSSSLFAQVKVGTNPTAIETASNLEVEASTTGRKVKVDKTTGQLTIADGTQGAGKVLTSDANGGASWQAAPSQTSPVWIYAKQSTTQTISGLTPIDFNIETADRGSNFDPSTDKITVPSSGIYQISCGTKKINTNAGGFNMALYVFVNGANHTIIYEDAWTTPSTLPRATGSLTLQLNAGDVVDVRITSNFNPYDISGSYLTMVKLSN
ncbi:hypothetical protein BWI93_13210 [Siphonobacter sp. BAB-5385]|uniref:C1q-like domain-containing protein n=1 Tax=unclassified Siphonobacter TaxID=2635712 RepID=UPI000B9E0B37|nr:MULTISPECIES: hypothetical protein [unclassified Siphonobacter]OZI07672.1 hypothetical protein BWI93_13210 [Siphonobacter sp. BAB-5385]PMD96198.1 hypothetical protein BWI97_12965 [Siphonobacter sp. BAB-5405]